MITQHASWLYQGAAADVDSREYQTRGIKAVLCLNENNERWFPPSGNNTDYLWCSFNDPGDTLTLCKLTAIENFARCFKGGGVLVHCFGGINRSSAITAYLLCTVDGVAPDEACRRVKANNHGCDIRDRKSVV